MRGSGDVVGANDDEHGILLMIMTKEGAKFHKLDE
jgi:hypothetical protein